MSKKKKKKQKKRHLFGKKEFLFNFFSLLAMIVIALYFGGRSFYYYSKQSMNKKIEAQTLNGLIIQNNPLSEADGLHQDKEGYFFKGNVSNNYVSFANRMFRIIPSIDKFLVKTTYTEDILKDDQVVTSKKKYQDFVTTLSIDDYILANGKRAWIYTEK